MADPIEIEWPNTERLIANHSRGHQANTYRVQIYESDQMVKCADGIARQRTGSLWGPPLDIKGIEAIPLVEFDGWHVPYFAAGTNFFAAVALANGVDVPEKDRGETRTDPAP